MCDGATTKQMDTTDERAGLKGNLQEDKQSSQHVLASHIFSSDRLGRRVRTPGSVRLCKSARDDRSKNTSNDQYVCFGQHREGILLRHIEAIECSTLNDCLDGWFLFHPPSLRALLPVRKTTCAVGFQNEMPFFLRRKKIV